MCVGGDKLWRPGIYEGRAASMSGAAYEVVYRFSDDMQNVGGEVQHEIREYIGDDNKKMNGQYLNGERVTLIADRKNPDTYDKKSHYVVHRYENDRSRGGNMTHELRGYPDHSFADYENQVILHALTWRDLAVVETERGLDANEKYEIECQDGIDPLRPEIRNYGVNGLAARYELWQLPDDKLDIYRFHDKRKETNINRKQGEKQPELQSALSVALREGVGMTAMEVNKIRRQWHHKKEAWDKWWETNQNPNGWHLESESETQQKWHERLYQPSTSHITNLLQELYKYG